MKFVYLTDEDVSFAKDLLDGLEEDVENMNTPNYMRTAVKERIKLLKKAFVNAVDEETLRKVETDA